MRLVGCTRTIRRLSVKKNIGMYWKHWWYTSLAISDHPLKQSMDNFEVGVLLALRQLCIMPVLARNLFRLALESAQ